MEYAIETLKEKLEYIDKEIAETIQQGIEYGAVFPTVRYEKKRKSLEKAIEILKAHIIESQKKPSILDI
jgi:hypothetical protein